MARHPGTWRREFQRLVSAAFPGAWNLKLLSDSRDAYRIMMHQAPKQLDADSAKLLPPNVGAALATPMPAEGHLPSEFGPLRAIPELNRANAAWMDETNCPRVEHAANVIAAGFILVRGDIIRKTVRRSACRQ